MVPISDPWFTFVGSGKRGALPLAWTNCKIQLHLLSASWRDLRLYLDQNELPIYLLKQGRELMLMAEWPASEPGYYMLSLYEDKICRYRRDIFVGTRHLEPQDWILLLQDLRYAWPRQSLSLKSDPQVPVSVGSDLNSFELEEVLCIKDILEGDAEQIGIFAALEYLSRSAISRPQLQTSVLPLYRVRHLDARLLFRNLSQCSPEQRVIQSVVKNSFDIPENRFLAYMALWLLEHLEELSRYLKQRGEQNWSQQLNNWYQYLFELWQKNELHTLEARPDPPQHLRLFLRQPAYFSFYQAWQLSRSGQLPMLSGKRKFAHQKFALLYQNWCLLQIYRCLLDWASQNGWEVQTYNDDLTRGRDLVCLYHPTKKAWLHLIPEHSYGFQGILFSATRSQRPDISLLLRRGNKRYLLVFECKFRVENKQPFKEDLDRLHAYRDAIRRADGSPVVCEAILLYPGPPIAYPPLLDAWQTQPGKIMNWPFDTLMKKLLAKF